jgi:hypothetical protein
MNTIRSLANHFQIPYVKALEANSENIQEFLADAKNLENAEGYVIRFHNGHQVKIKGEWYCQIHNTKDAIGFEKNVWAIILDERMDDLKPFMDESDRAAVDNFMNEFEQEVAKTAHRLAAYVEQAKAKFGDNKKLFAMEVMPSKDIVSYEKGLLFSIWDDKNPIEVVLNCLKKYVGTKTKIDEIRPLVGGISWNRYFKETIIECE